MAGRSAAWKRVVRIGQCALGGAVAISMAFARIVAAQQPALPPDEDANQYVTPVIPMLPVPLDRSLAELVAMDWRVAGVTLSGRMLHYHLVANGALAICVVDRLPNLPASRCVRLDPAPR